MFRQAAFRAAQFFLAAAVVLSGPWAGGALAQQTEADYRRALQVISDKLHERYPHLEGVIVAVKGGDLYLSLGRKDRATKGVKLSVYRKGRPFRHPVTGVVLGTLEDEIGVAEVVEVREKFSIARMVRLTPGKDLAPRVKDIVRLSSAKIRFAVLPFVNKTKEAFGTEVLTRELARLLLSKGRFDVFDVDQLQVWFLENGLTVDEILKGRNPILLRNHIRADLALESTIRDVKGKKVLTSRLLSLTTRKELFKAASIADELPFEQRAPKEQALRRGEGGRGVSAPNPSFILDREGVPGARGGTSSYVFNGVTFRGVAVADVNGDGKNEVIVLTSNEVIVYQFGHNRMRELARFSESVANDFRWIDVADMNGNGVPEIYIANYRFEDLLSMVVEMKGREFVRLVSNENTFFRLIRVRRSTRQNPIPDADAYLLLGQAQGPDGEFAEPIQRFRWAGKRLRAAAPYVLPTGLTILGFGLWDLDKDGSLDVVEVGKDDVLRVYSRRGEVRFKSAARYGAPVHTFYDIRRASSSDDPELEGPKLLMRSRVLAEDMDGDGVDEVLVVANEYAGTSFVPGLGISGGQLVSLVWDGNGLSEIWRSKRLSNGVVDFAVGDVNGDGLLDLVVVSTNAELLADRKSYIYIYKIKG